MAWNPSFSFKLRDDEITFGTLIFDKNCANMLCEELLRMKRGGQVSLYVIRNILEQGCFTDTELDNARAELECIKQDIFEFKQLLTNKQRFEAWYDTTASTGAYVVGSQSWYQHYMSLKMTAADMYFKLISSGEQFTPEAKINLDKRYGEVLRESSAKERTELALRRQFDINTANGIPNARDIYCEAMMTAGLMSQEQVDAQNKLFKAAGSSEVEPTIDNSKSSTTPCDDNKEEDLLSDTQTVSNDRDIDVDEIIKLYNDALNISNKDERTSILSDLSISVIKILKNAEIMCAGAWEETIEEYLDGGGLDGAMIDVAKALKNVLSFEANKNIINTYNLSDKDINYTKLAKQINEARESSIVGSSIEENEKDIASIDLINNLWAAVKSHTALRSLSLAVEKFHFHVKQILADIGVTLNNDILEVELENFFIKKNVTANKLRETAILYVNYLNTGRPSESIKATSVEYSVGKIEAMIDDVKSIKDK